MRKFTKILGYARVSTTEQAQDGRTSLASQEQAIRGAALMNGFETVEIFADPGVSGGVPLAERPAGSRLVAALQPGCLVIAPKLDRIFRSALDVLGTVERWKKQRVDLILSDCGAEPVSENGNSKLFFSLMASFAEWERSRIRERMLDGKAGKRARGGATGGATPYGFKKIGEGRAAILVPDEGEQRTIAHIKNLRASGCTYAEMIELLTQRGVMLRSGKPWTDSQLHRVLHAEPRALAA
jgi:DNA invertase Pin-like site-specific DNA recombinase